MDNFKESLKMVLVHEGGYGDHPKDPGGATNKGVTIAVFRRFFGKDKTKDDLRNITDEEISLVYRKGYWDKCKCDKLPTGVDYVVFDAAVNSGVSRSSKWLQSAIGARQDGIIGSKTLARANQFPGHVSLIIGMCDLRFRFLTKLKTWEVFGRGWSNRIDRVRIDGISMVCKGIKNEGL